MLSLSPAPKSESRVPKLGLARGIYNAASIKAFAEYAKLCMQLDIQTLAIQETKRPLKQVGD